MSRPTNQQSPHIVEAAYQGLRLDVYVADILEQRLLTRRQARKLCEAGQVFVDGRVRPKGYLVQAGQVVSLTRPEATSPDMPVCLVAQTSELFVLEKPRGVHSVKRFESSEQSVELSLELFSLQQQETLPSSTISSLPAESGQPGLPDSGLVQRLDFWTSGLLLAGRSIEACNLLRQLIDGNAVEKSYLAIIEGLPEKTSYTVSIGIDSANKKRVLVTDSGRPAKSRIRVCHRDRETKSSLVLVVGKSMHRHQVRAHLASIGYPLLGDVLYGATRCASTNEGESLDGFFLHARSIRFSAANVRGRLASLSEPRSTRYTSSSWRDWPSRESKQ